MRVLVVSSKYPPEYAGSGLRAHNTYRRLARKYGVEFDVLAGSEEFNGVKRYAHEGVAVRRIALKTGIQFFPCREETKWKYWSKKLINHLFYVIHYCCEALATMVVLARCAPKYDLFHVFGKNHVTSAALIYAKITGKPVIVELVNLSDNPHQYEPWIVKRLCGGGLPRHALIICISEYLRDVCLKAGYSASQLWCRPNPIDETRYFLEPDRKRRCREDNICVREGEVVVLHLAKFIPRKHQLFMVDVMAYLPSNYRLILAGPLIQGGPLLQRDMSYYESIVGRVRELKLQDRVSLHPRYVEEPQRFIKMADVFVLPSTDEAFGTPFIEAMACGVPVVTNDIPGVFDRWITQGEDGFICSLEPKRWAECIVKAAAIDNEKMRRASMRVLDLASTARIDAQYYDHLQRLIAQGEC
ncbi:MAG: glycosyltransferase family 4 protein [Candidatus Omnitrophota bacterium]